MFGTAAKLCSLTLLLLAATATLAGAQEEKPSSPGISEERLNKILVAIAELDSRLKIVRASDFSIESGDLTIKIKADKFVLYDGKPFQAPHTGLYGKIEVSERFYGVELLLHYSLFQNGVHYGGASIEERLTVIYENTPRFKPLRPRTFASKPFVVSEDGAFQDRQVFGRFDAPVPETTTQILRQELILNSELIATIYIVRTPREIRAIGYSVPPLVPTLNLQK
jgi:hypothetical protein